MIFNAVFSYPKIDVSFFGRFCCASLSAGGLWAFFWDGNSVPQVVLWWTAGEKNVLFVGKAEMDLKGRDQFIFVLYNETRFNQGFPSFKDPRRPK